MGNAELQLLLIASINNSYLVRLLKHVDDGTATMPADLVESLKIVLQNYRDLNLVESDAASVQKDRPEDDQ